MNHAKLLLITTFACAIVVALAGCSTRTPDPSIYMRNAGLTVVSATGMVLGPAPLTVGTLPHFSGGEQDKQRTEDIVSKAEVDYGAGAGFVDITTASRQLWAINGSIGFDQLIQHTYPDPGSYTVRLRVTYWDGEVVLSDMNPIITVQ